MSQKLFTAEEVEELKKSPHTASVTKRSVTFTPEFKQIAYDEYMSGKSGRQIFETYGIDPDSLGTIRIRGFFQRLEKEADREEGFENLHKNNCRHEAKSTEAQLAKELTQLKNRIAYLEQENDFLKKLRDLEAASQSKAVK